ncbi:MAG: hypothetical protein LCH54_02925 [Bacteroidetes bacterium]|nr:hypothetical protein [Bacteroidota bacterium]
MSNELLNQNQIETIVNPIFDEHFWFYQLGVSLSVGKKDNFENQFSFNFYSTGKDYWNNVINKLTGLLCDRENKKPKATLDEILNGDIRNLAVYLLTLVIADLGVSVTVGIPIVSLILKQGLKGFCLRS